MILMRSQTLIKRSGPDKKNEIDRRSKRQAEGNFEQSWSRIEVSKGKANEGSRALTQLHLK